MNHDNTPMYFEAVKYPENKPSKEGRYWVELFDVEMPQTCYFNGESFETKEHETVWSFLRPISIVSDVSDDNLKEWVGKEWNRIDIQNVAIEGGQWMHSKLTPTIALLKQENEKLFNEKVALALELATEKEKSGEFAIGFAEWIIDEVLTTAEECMILRREEYAGKPIEQIYSLYLTSLTDKQSEGK